MNSPASRIRTGARSTVSAKPSVEGTPRGSRIKTGNVPGQDITRWAFSFQYWKQIEYFGLDQAQPTWFVAVLTKLQELSTKSVDEFRTSSADRDAWRYHEINWSQKNIPIKRADLTWIDAVFLENDEDYPLYQFQITQSLGRVIGFWDNKKLFNIVLFDPLHNMQPSRSHNYRVNPCSPLSCDYTLLLDQVHQITSKCASGGCQHADSLRDLKHRKKELEAFNVVMMKFPDDAQLVAANQLIEEGVATSHSEIFEYGVSFLSDKT